MLLCRGNVNIKWVSKAFDGEFPLRAFPRDHQLMNFASISVMFNNILRLLTIHLWWDFFLHETNYAQKMSHFGYFAESRKNYYLPFIKDLILCPHNEIDFLQSKKVNSIIHDKITRSKKAVKTISFSFLFIRSRIVG